MFVSPLLSSTAAAAAKIFWYASLAKKIAIMRCCCLYNMHWYGNTHTHTYEYIMIITDSFARYYYMVLGIYGSSSLAFDMGL